MIYLKASSVPPRYTQRYITLEDTPNYSFYLSIYHTDRNS